MVARRLVSAFGPFMKLNIGGGGGGIIATPGDKKRTRRKGGEGNNGQGTGNGEEKAARDGGKRT